MDRARARLEPIVEALGAPESTSTRQRRRRDRALRGRGSGAQEHLLAAGARRRASATRRANAPAFSSWNERIVLGLLEAGPIRGAVFRRQDASRPGAESDMPSVVAWLDSKRIVAPVCRPRRSAPARDEQRPATSSMQGRRDGPAGRSRRPQGDERPRPRRRPGRQEAGTAPSSPRSGGCSSRSRGRWRGAGRRGSENGCRDRPGPVPTPRSIAGPWIIPAPPARTARRSRAPPPAGAGAAPVSDVEAEQHHVAVLDDIFLAFGAHLAGLLRSRLAAEADEILIGDGLGADEAALEIGVDDPGRLRRLRAVLDRPGAGFLGAGGEEGDEVEEVVAGADDPGEAGLLEAEVARGIRAGRPGPWSRSRPRSPPR